MADERLIVFEPGITRAFGLAARPNSPLIWVLRNAWDGQPLEIRSRRGRRVIDAHHIGLLAHATVDQLQARLSMTEASASLVNRFVFILAVGATGSWIKGTCPQS